MWGGVEFPCSLWAPALQHLQAFTAWKLSEPHYSVFSWQFHHIGILDDISDTWELIPTSLPPWRLGRWRWGDKIQNPMAPTPVFSFLWQAACTLWDSLHYHRKQSSSNSKGLRKVLCQTLGWRPNVSFSLYHNITLPDCVPCGCPAWAWDMQKILFERLLN